MSESDLSGRLPRPRIALERRPLSNSASTASCSMRFSLRRMTSGARCRISFCSRLLRLITRRYRSFRSDVAKRPPSSGTSGRRSGGMTGMTSRIIQRGSFRPSPAWPELRNASTILRRLSCCFLRCWLVSPATASRSSSASLSTFSRSSSARTAGAPISALNAASPSFLALARPFLYLAEDALAEQPIPFRLEGPVVDGLGLGHLAPRPPGALALQLEALPLLRVARAPDLLRRGDPDLDIIEARGLRLASAPEVDHYSSTFSVVARISLHPRAWSSFTNTLKDSGMPGFGRFCPFTMASYTRLRPFTSSDLTVRISCSVCAAP